MGCAETEEAEERVREGREKWAGEVDRRIPPPEPGL